MLQHKLQRIQQSIIQQSGQERLILNDLVLNRDAIQMVATLIPKYHANIRHLEIKGNNIDSEGFQAIFSALLHCSHLKSIEAQWNNIGAADKVNGLQALTYLVQKIHNLEFIDLKNNRINHVLSFLLAEIIEANRPNLKVIDLRWNDLGELGAKNILRSLPFNKNIKFIGLEDNRISTGTLMEIQTVLKMVQEPTPMKMASHHQSMRNIHQFADKFYPISQDQYPSMDNQLRNAELRSKIDMQQKQASLYTEKTEVEIQKVLQKIKLRGTQMNQMQSKYDTLQLENRKLVDDLREAERMITLEKERLFGLQRNLVDEKSRMRAEKYRLNSSIQSVMEKYTQRNQRELEELDLVMGQKLDRLTNFLKERLHQKRTHRQKLSQIKEDIMKVKLNKEDCWNRGTATVALAIKSTYQQQCFAIDQLIHKSSTTISSEIKKGDHLSQELKNIILRALKKENKLESDIFEEQNKIKKIHNEMALKNLENEVNIVNIKRKQSKEMDCESNMNILRMYMKFVQHHHNLNLEIQGMKNEELKRVTDVGGDSLDIRIADLQRALKSQQSQNKLIRNQYEKLLVLVENSSKKALQSVLFE